MQDKPKIWAIPDTLVKQGMWWSLERYNHVFEKINLKNINGLYLILFHELLLGKESSELDSFNHVFKTRSCILCTEPLPKLQFSERRAIDMPKYTICLILRGVAWHTVEPGRYLRFFQSPIIKYWRKERLAKLPQIPLHWNHL